MISGFKISREIQMYVYKIFAIWRDFIFLLDFCSGECYVGDRLHWTNFLKPYNDDKLKSNIKLSSVNINYDANVWDWDLVTAIFKSPVSDAFKTLEVPDYRNFVRRVLDYFKVSFQCFFDKYLVKNLNFYMFFFSQLMAVFVDLNCQIHNVDFWLGQHVIFLIF